MQSASVQLTFPAGAGLERAAPVVDELTDSVVGWAAQRGTQFDPFAIPMALEHRLDTDGRLGRWRSGDLVEILLDWFPRKVTLAAPDRAAVVPALGLLIDYLAEQRLLQPGSDDPAELHRTLTEREPEFLAAMADESRYDIGKFWATRMLERGVDLDDPADVNQFIAESQLGNIEVDQSVVDSILQRQFSLAGPGGPGGAAEELEQPDLPPVLLPSAADLSAAAGASPAVAQIREFVQWVGEGRKVTKAGRLTLADGRDLATLLDVDSAERADARSSVELGQVSLIVAWAAAAGLVRVVKGRMVPVKRSAPLLRRPVELWHQLFAVLGELGEQVCGGGAGQFGNCFEDEFETLIPVVCMALYTAGGAAIPLELIHAVVRDELADSFGMAMAFSANPRSAPVAVELQEQLWRRDLDQLIEVLESFGAVQRAPATDPAILAKIAEVSEMDFPDSTLVGLTPIGIWAVNDMLRSEGITAPVVGDLAGSAMDALCRALLMADPDVTEAELTAWVKARGDGAAVKELVGFISGATESSHRLFGFLALGYAGDAGLAAATELRAAGGVVGAVAAGWLVEREALGPDAITPAELHLGLFDSLAAMHEQGFLIDELSALPPSDQLEMVRRLGAIDHPRRLAVLDTIAADHPNRKIAKEAGKIRLRLRTAGVND